MLSISDWKVAVGLLLVVSCCFTCLFITVPGSYQNQISFDRNLSDFLDGQDPDVETIINAAIEHSENSSLLWKDAKVQRYHVYYDCSATACILSSVSVVVDIRFRFETPFYYEGGVIGYERTEEETTDMIFSTYSVASTLYHASIADNTITARTGLSEQYFETVERRSVWGERFINPDEAIELAHSTVGKEFEEAHGKFSTKIEWIDWRWHIILSADDLDDDTELNVEINPFDGSMTVIDDPN